MNTIASEAGNPQFSPRKYDRATTRQHYRWEESEKNIFKNWKQEQTLRNQKFMNCFFVQAKMNKFSTIMRDEYIVSHELINQERHHRHRYSLILIFQYPYNAIKLDSNERQQSKGNTNTSSEGAHRSSFILIHNVQKGFLDGVNSKLRAIVRNNKNSCNHLSAGSTLSDFCFLLIFRNALTISDPKTYETPLSFSPQA